MTTRDALPPATPVGARDTAAAASSPTTTSATRVAAPEGPEASLAATLLPTGATASHPVDTEATRLASGWEERYAFVRRVGEGGMGEVQLYRDQCIGRDVALKRLRAEHVERADLHTRFLREARVQGQLEHPAVVPVYDLAAQPGGGVYFTMKHVQGATLEAVLARLRAGEPGAIEAYSRRRLLSAFSTVCLALDYAHRRGVVHRDLKPGNLMLGDFGEVYVLDWGLARAGDQAMAGELEAAEAATRADALPLDAQARNSGATAVGAVLGTPGYMAPEQIRGETADARADIYALGAILFELLALEPLHAESTVAGVVYSTLEGTVDRRPSSRPRGRELPPELDAICVRATARDPAERFPTARALHGAIEGFLDGARDAERRRALADAHARAAHDAAAAAHAGDVAARSQALSEVGRALALDPDHVAARHILVRLLTEPPDEPPPEARAESEANRAQQLRVAHLTGAVASLVYWALAPLLFGMGVRELRLFALGAAVFTLASLYHAVMYRRTRRGLQSNSLATAAVGAAQAAVAALLLGPFVIVPSALSTSAIAAIVSDDRRSVLQTTAVSCAGFLLPLCAEWVGLLPPSYAFRDGALVLLPRMVNLSPGPAIVLLVVTTLLQIVAACAFAARFRGALTAAQDRLRLMAWQLRQLVRETQTPPPPAP